MAGALSLLRGATAARVAARVGRAPVAFTPLRSLSKRVRADTLMVEMGLADTRSRAAALIALGYVLLGDTPVLKAGAQIALSDAERLRFRAGTEQKTKYASRGGIKLEHALDRFGLSPEGAIAVDVGSSTGGFTDVLLQRGAHRVYAVDVGRDQLLWRLRQDPRVVSLEKTDARYISCVEVLPTVMDMCDSGGQMVALVKPNFEVPRGEVPRSGVVRSAEVHERVCTAAAAFVEQRGWAIVGIEESPIRGPKGNKEFLLVAAKHAA